MRFWGVLAAAVLLVMLLMWQYPYAAGNTDRNMSILYLVLMIALVGSSGMFSRISGSRALRDAAIWLGIILLIAFAYSFRADIKGTRFYGSLVPQSVQVMADGSLRIARAQDGHFHVDAEVNHSPESFLIDTGASDIVLSQRAAEAAGLAPETLNYSRIYSTANGTVSAAPVKLESLRVGPILIGNIPASVNKGELEESLLGMTFLNQFKSYQVQDDTLTLYP